MPRLLKPLPIRPGLEVLGVDDWLLFTRDTATGEIGFISTECDRNWGRVPLRNNGGAGNESDAATLWVGCAMLRDDGVTPEPMDPECLMAMREWLGLEPVGQREAA